MRPHADMVGQFRDLYYSRTSEDERIALLAHTCQVMREIDLSFQDRAFRVQLAAETDRYEKIWGVLVCALRELDAYDHAAVDRALAVVDANV